MSAPSEEMRDYLNDWPNGKNSVDVLADKYPNCACENAAVPPGGHGPVQSDETLRFFIPSRTTFDAKYPAKTKSTFNPTKLSRLFSEGLSLCRVIHASEQEVFNTAKNLHAVHFKSDNNFGGLMGVVDFVFEKILALKDCDDVRYACVIETPIGEPTEPIGFKPSHADMVASRPNCDKQVVRSLVFNAIKEDTESGFQCITEVDGGKLAEFLPESQI